MVNVTKLDAELIKVASYYDIKGCFSIELRESRNSFRPVISISSRFQDIIGYIHQVLQKFSIKHSIIIRGVFSTLRISSAKSCIRFYDIFDKYIYFKHESYDVVYRLSYIMILKNKEMKKSLMNDFQKTLTKKVGLSEVKK